MLFEESAKSKWYVENVKICSKFNNSNIQK